MSLIDEKVTGGQLKVNLVVDKIPFISTSLDLCDIASMAGLSCPISAGQQMLKVSQQIPEEAPSVRILKIVLYRKSFNYSTALMLAPLGIG